MLKPFLIFILATLWLVVFIYLNLNIGTKFPYETVDDIEIGVTIYVLVMIVVIIWCL